VSAAYFIIFIVTPMACSLEMKSLVPNAELKILPKCGHFPTLQHPDVISDALKTWLMRVAK